MQQNEEQLAKISYEARLYQQQGQALAQQLDLLQATADELNTTLETLKSLPSSKGRGLLPVGAGVFLNAGQFDSKSILVNIGAGIVLEMGVENATALLGKRAAAAAEARQKMQQSLAQVSQRLQQLEGDASRIMGAGNVQPPQE